MPFDISQTATDLGLLERLFIKCCGVESELVRQVATQGKVFLNQWKKQDNASMTLLDARMIQQGSFQDLGTVK